MKQSYNDSLLVILRMKNDKELSDKHHNIEKEEWKLNKKQSKKKKN